MMAIVFLFVRMLGDCFKSRLRLEAETLSCGINSMFCNSAPRGCICSGPAVPYSFSSIVAVLAFLTP